MAGGELIAPNIPIFPKFRTGEHCAGFFVICRLPLIVDLVLVFVFALPVALDGLGSGVAGGATIDYPAAMLGIDKQTWSGDWLDFYDMLSEGIMMPLGAMIMTFGIGWIWKIDMVVEECEASGHKFWGKTFFDICYKFITPIGMAFVLYGQITSFFN